MAGSPWAGEAALKAALKNKPANEGLAFLQRNAEERYAGQVQAGSSEGLMAQQAAQRALPAVQAIYNTAAKTGERSRSLLGPALETLSPNSPFRAAAANEAASGAESLASNRSKAESDVQQRAVAAAELPASMQNAARVTLLKELQQIQQSGAKVKATEQYDQQLGEEASRKEASKNKLTERGQNITAHGQSITAQNDRESRELQKAGLAQKLFEHEHPAVKAGKESTTGLPPGYLPVKEQDKAQSTVAKVKELAEVGLKAGQSAQQVKEHLTKGKPAVTVEGVKTKGTAAIPPGVLLDAGVEAAQNGGYVSPETLQRLHEAKYSAKLIGLKSSGPPVKSTKEFGSQILKALSW